jgi:AcrR family transcriptional regulator
MARDTPARRRPGLSRARVIEAAVSVADRDGLGAVTMRRLGTELGVEAMSLYKHIADKDDILDGMVDLVFGEIELPAAGGDWRAAMRPRLSSAREVLRRHSWAIGLFESRGAVGPGTLRYVDSTLGALRSAGFSVVDAGYAFSLLDSFVHGHVTTEASASVPSGEEGAPPEVQRDYPNLAEVMEPGRGFSFDGAFEFGLELLLDALEARRVS